MRLRAGLFSLLLTASMQGGQRILIPAWVGGSRCQVGTMRAAITPEGVLLLPCDSDTDRVTCSFVGAEPIDMLEKAACSLATLPVRRSTDLKVRAADPTEATVEWLEVSPDGRLSTLTARPERIDGQLTLQVAQAEDRLLRFVRSGASPVTVSTSKLWAADSWLLPAPQPGGELVIRTPAATVLPMKYLVTGPGAGHEIVRGNVFENLTGLSVGSYVLTSVYSSGTYGRIVPFNVSLGGSTYLSLSPEQVGAARFTLNEAACSLGGDLVLRSLTTDLAGRSSASKPLGRVHPENCDLLVDGLAPGHFKVALARAGSTVASAELDVTPQEVTRVAIDVDATIVTGHALLNDKPLGSVTLSFEPETESATAGSNPRDQAVRIRTPASRSDSVKVTTAADGSYTAVLGSPGSYVATLSYGQFAILGQDREFVALPGSSVFDISIKGGALEFNIPNWDKVSAVLIDLRRATRTDLVGGMATTAVTYMIRPTDPLPFQVPGLAFGAYEVSARETGDVVKVSPRKVTTLDADHAIRRIDLPLAENRATLYVLDESGNPVTGATVQGGVAKLSGPGQFDLSQVPPGSALHVSAVGLVPACRVSPDSGATQVVLAQGRSATVYYLTPRPMASPDGFFELPGSDCLVNVYDFQFARRPQATGNVSAFVFTNFPSGGFIVTPSGGRVPIPTAGPLSLKWQ